jgi:RNA polymerase sigma factor (sigma-70 family)
MATGPSNAVIRHVRRVAFLHERAGMTDGQLLDRFLTQRDEAAFEALMRRHGPMVLSVCRRVLADPHDAEDAFQATFLVLVRKAASLKQRELVGNWLYGAAYRAALEAKAARRRSRERQVHPMPEPIAATAEIGEDLRPLLDRELSRLPDKYRVPVVLCDLEGRTRREVARQLGVPVGTLSGRLTTARRRLAERLTRHGVVLSSTGLVAVLWESTASARVPAPLAASTLKAVTAVAAGQAALAGIVSANVAALTEGVMRTMLLTNLKSMTTAFLAATLIGGGVTLLAYHAVGAEQKAAQLDVPAQAAAAEDEEARPDKEKKQEQDKPAKKTYGYLGVLLKGNDDPQQVIVHEVFPDSPAAKADIQAGDVLLKVGDAEVKDPNAAVEILKASKPGDKLTIHFKRADKEKSADITLGKWPAEEPGRAKAKDGEGGKDEKAPGYLGLILRDDAENGGVAVHDVAPDSPAAKAGFKPDDLLLQVGKEQVKDVSEFIKGMANLKAGDKVTLRIQRGGKEIEITVTAAKRPADFGKM